MKVLVYGGRHYNNVQMLYETFFQLRELGLETLVTMNEVGAATILRSCAHSYGSKVIVAEPNWLIHGRLAERNLRLDALQHHQPDMVVLLPGQESDTNDMNAVCQAQGQSVWDLRELAWVDLGSGYQLGEEPAPGDEPL